MNPLRRAEDLGRQAVRDHDVIADFDGKHLAVLPS
jgi:hypothetical protein